MPSFSTAVTFLLFLLMTSSATSTTTGVVRTIKNNKKEGLIKNTADTCTMEHFRGKSQYTNCAQAEIEVEIVCDYTDNTATATTKKICSYSEKPVPSDDVAAAVTAVGCGDHGFFDPETHLIMDHVNGMCPLKFFRLTSTCIGALASSGFGVMVEVASRTGTGKETHYNDNSGTRPTTIKSILAERFLWVQAVHNETSCTRTMTRRMI